MKPQDRDAAHYVVSILGLFLCLAVAPLFYTTLMRDVFTLPKALPLALGTCVIWLGLARTGEVSFDRTLTPGIAAMSAAIILSALFSVDTPLSIIGPHQQQFYAIVPMAICVLAFYAASNSEGIPPEGFVNMALIGGVAVSLLAISQVGGQGFQSWSIQGGRAGSTFGAPIFLGFYLAMLLPLAWTKKHETCGYLWLNLILAGLLATGSRGSIMAATVGVVVAEFLRNRHKANTIKVLAIILPAIIFVGAIFVLRKTAHNSDSGRIEIWRIAVKAWLAHPLMGWGPDTFSMAFRRFMTQRFIDSNNGNDKFVQLSAHNDILQVLSTLGIIGLAAYALFCSRIVRLLRDAIDHEPEAIGIAGAAAAMFVNAKFNPAPLAAIGVGACLLGSLDRSILVDRPRADFYKIAAATFSSIVLVTIIGVMCKAEWHARRAEDIKQLAQPIQAAEQYNIAAHVNPFDLWYTQMQMDYFWKIIPRLPGVSKEQLASFSHDITETALRLHPYDPIAHDLRGMSYEFEGDMIGGNRHWEAEKEFAIAERLAPLFSSYAERRVLVNRFKHKK